MMQITQNIQIYISKKVRLYPTKAQVEKLKQFCGTNRWAYNHFLKRNKEEYETHRALFLEYHGVEYSKENAKMLGERPFHYSDYDCKKELTILKKLKEYSWLNDMDSHIPAYAMANAKKAFDNFYAGRAKFPKRKLKKDYRDGYQFDSYRFKLYKPREVLIPKIGKMLTQESIVKQTKYINPTVSFDGVNWWLSFGCEQETELPTLTNEVIGIDLGIKELAVCSDGKVYKNINKTKRVKQLKKRYKRQQRNLSRQITKARQAKTKLGKNFEKNKRDLNRTQIKLNNIRNNHLHQVTTEIVKKLPRTIVMEDLNVSGMVKNRHLSKAIAEQSFYKFRQMIEYKAKNRGIQLIFADKFYPSSKICSCCRHKKLKLSLSERTYVCEECGFKIDRDLNAALNLRNLAI
jgi:putative transposase